MLRKGTIGRPCLRLFAHSVPGRGRCRGWSWGGSEWISERIIVLRNRRGGSERICEWVRNREWICEWIAYRASPNSAASSSSS